LEDSHTGERHGFANLAQLIAFLEQQLGQAASRNALSSDDDDHISAGEVP
jgi:hypothetical protein